MQFHKYLLDVPFFAPLELTCARTSPVNEPANADRPPMNGMAWDIDIKERTVPAAFFVGVLGKTVGVIKTVHEVVSVLTSNCTHAVRIADSTIHVWKLTIIVKYATHWGAHLLQMVACFVSRAVPDSIANGLHHCLESRYDLSGWRPGGRRTCGAGRGDHRFLTIKQSRKVI